MSEQTLGRILWGILIAAAIGVVIVITFGLNWAFG